ncbi:diguanylate cyclase [Aliirhizobium terrae]|uniref:sensor domain-containing protein n=1 Tax=Terrirhizobium terrae TaxID=2926709 RepID=UPI00257557DB|nr:bifunctional diguanylate cyclase/phosphodiesterase [Rhizobium sp. CC-CFT758]WJH40107.1 diguanylate cyclase [Rhizobium sp. CC-CFT758]
MLVAVFEAVPFPTVLIDRDGRLLHLNRAFEANWSKTRPDFLADLLHPNDGPALHALIANWQGGSTAAIELRLPRPDGTLRWATVTLAAPSTMHGEAVLIAASFADITALKQQISELSALESRWNNALVSSVTGVWDHNWATGQKYYSPTWRRIRGMTLDDPLPASTAAWLDLLHPDDRDRVLHSIERQNAGDPDYAVFDYRERHKDGHWIWIECRGNCVAWDENGKPTHIVGTDTDITARKLAEEAAARMSRRLDMALEISGVGVYECDLTTGIVDWDERMFRIYGLSRREDVRVGGLWETLLHPDDAERVLAKVDEHVRDGSRFSDQYRVLLRDGSEHIIRARTMSFVDNNGHDMTVGANWDVTEDVRLHRDLERAKILAEARNIELEAAKERIEHSAMHDYLTELPNRRYLDEVLDRMSAECHRSGDGIAVLHIDLDRFKHINDSLGHGAGDAMLRHTAEVLRSSVRRQDFVARIGGDEFVVVMPIDNSEASLPASATRIIGRLGRPVAYEGQLCRVGASIGVASDYGRDIDVRQLLRNSDIALYQAKRQGRNRCVFFSPQAKAG